MLQFTNSLDSLMLQKKGKEASAQAEKALPACRRSFQEKQEYWLKWKDRV